MKRRLLVSLLAFAGGLTVVGSGFSAWYFNENKAISTSGNINHYITDLNGNIGQLTDLNVNKKLYIVLDQGGYSNARDLTKGVSITYFDSTDDSISDSNLGTSSDATIGCKYSIEEDDYTTLTNANISSGIFTATFSLSTEASNYLKFKAESTYDTTKATLPIGGNFVITDTTTTYTYTLNYNNEQFKNDKFQEFKFDASTKDNVNVMLQYKDGMKPTSNSEYSAMKTALNGKTLMTISYKFEIPTQAA